MPRHKTPGRPLNRARKPRRRGHIGTLPSGSLRVRVHSGTDPITHRPHYLSETIPAGPTAEQQAERVLQRLIDQIDQQRRPRTNITLDELINQHIARLHASITTTTNYRGQHRKHIAPLIGHHTIDAITPETLDTFYAELARCRDHCTPPPAADHHAATPGAPANPGTSGAHHDCRPLLAETIRKIHFLISGAYHSAQRWKWTTTNPATLANPPSKPRPHPQPPRPTEVARILTHAWTEPNLLLAVVIWTAITTGARRGELCALRWTDFDPQRRVLHIHSSIAHDGPNLVQKDTKLHQRRHIALDPDTTALLVAYHHRCRELAAAHGITLAPNSFIFSPTPDGSICTAPNSLGQRFHRLAARLGIHTTLHKLRHYNATELILSGVNLRTVAGRLGHKDCGMTLNTYTAWIDEADQRASALLANRLPLRLTVTPQQTPAPTPRSLATTPQLLPTQAPPMRPPTHRLVPHRTPARRHSRRHIAGHLRAGHHLPTKRAAALADR